MGNLMILIEGVHTHANTTTNEYALENNNYGEGAPVYTWLLSPRIVEEDWIYNIVKKEYALAETCYGLKIVKIKSFKIVKDKDLKDVNLQHGMDLRYIIKLYDAKEINIENPRVDWDEFYGRQENE